METSRKVKVVTWGNPFEPDEPHRYGLAVDGMHVVSKGAVRLYDTRDEACIAAAVLRGRLSRAAR